jgi:PAS domain S-box-containing protein
LRQRPATKGCARSTDAGWVTRGRAARVRTGRGWRGRDILTPLFLSVTVTVVGLVGYGQLVASRAAEHRAQLALLSDEVAQNVGTANLHLQRARGGDPSVPPKTDIFGDLMRAGSLISAAINGGTVAGTHIDAVSDPVLSGDLRQLSEAETTFSHITKELWAHRDSTGHKATSSDRRSNHVYGLVLSAAQQLGHDANAQASEERSTTSRLNLLALAILFIFSGGAALIAKRTRRSIVSKNAELEEGVRQRTAELARTQARTEAIVNNAVDSVITIDETGTILSVNPATLRMFGFDEGEMIGKNVSVIMEREDARHHDQFIRRYVESGRSTVLGMGMERVGRRADGNLFPIEISVSEAVVPGEKNKMFVGSIRDITERKATEAELHAAKEAAEEAATHDPLTGLWNHNRIIEALMVEIAR